jgi:hypothetical protein
MFLLKQEINEFTFYFLNIFKRYRIRKRKSTKKAIGAIRTIKLKTIPKIIHSINSFLK